VPRGSGLTGLTGLRREATESMAVRVEWSGFNAARYWKIRSSMTNKIRQGEQPKRQMHW